MHDRDRPAARAAYGRRRSARPGSVRGPALAHEHLVLDLTTGADGAAVLHPDRHAAAVTAELAALRGGVRARSRRRADLPRHGPGRRRPGPDRPRTRRSPSSPRPGGTTSRSTPPRSPPPTSTSSPPSSSARSSTGIGSSGIRPGVLGEIGSHGATHRRRDEGAARRRAGRRPRPDCPSPPTPSSAVAASPSWSSSPPRAAAAPRQHRPPGPARRSGRAPGDRGGRCVRRVRHRRQGELSERRHRLRLLLALLEAGHAERVLLSCDISRHGYLRTEGGQGYGHLFR